MEGNNAGRVSHKTLIDNKSHESISTMITKRKDIFDDTRAELNSRNVCYCSAYVVSLHVFSL
jgi:hypothetical protein